MFNEDPVARVPKLTGPELRHYKLKHCVIGILLTCRRGLMPDATKLNCGLCLLGDAEDSKFILISRVLFNVDEIGDGAFTACGAVSLSSSRQKSQASLLLLLPIPSGVLKA